MTSQATVLMKEWKKPKQGKFNYLSVSLKHDTGLKLLI